MPVVVTDLPLETDAPRKRWTRKEYHALSAAHIGEQKLELVEGELISKMGKKRPHVVTLTLLMAWLTETFGPRFVNSEAPIDVSPEDNVRNEPEPDLIVLDRDQAGILESNPGPAELLLVVEIAATTLGFDLKTKSRLYARARIAEYWVVDIPGRRFIVHRDPAEGRYRSVTAYSEDEFISPLAAPESRLRVGDVLPVPPALDQ